MSRSTERVDAEKTPTIEVFVVRLYSDGKVEDGRLAGKVEHVESGRAVRFRDLDELLDFFAVSRELASGD